VSKLIYCLFYPRKLSECVSSSDEIGVEKVFDIKGRTWTSLTKHVTSTWERDGKNVLVFAFSFTSV